MQLKGKTAVLAVTGSIAAYKIVNLARMLKKLGCNVQVLMTRNATEFITPLTFEELTGSKCLVDTFDRNFQYNVEHVALAKLADVVLVAPASANVIGKIANGIADDMLTTTVMACPCKKIISPAMNHNMYHNPIVQDNLQKLARFGYEIIPPEHGMLANGDSGDGRMPEESVLLEYVLKEIACEKDLTGKKVLVTAGATRESIDPVRFITNHSSGKMGFALAPARGVPRAGGPGGGGPAPGRSQCWPPRRRCRRRSSQTWCGGNPRRICSRRWRPGQRKRISSSKPRLWPTIHRWRRRRTRLKKRGEN